MFGLLEHFDVEREKKKEGESERENRREATADIILFWEECV